jgi:hypothetical protein
MSEIQEFIVVIVIAMQVAALLVGFITHDSRAKNNICDDLRIGHFVFFGVFIGIFISKLLHLKVSDVVKLFKRNR